MRAMDVMTTNVITVTPDTSVQALATLLSERGISGFLSSIRQIDWSASSAKAISCTAPRPGQRAGQNGGASGGSILSHRIRSLRAIT
jgi:CBS domain